MERPRLSPAVKAALFAAAIVLLVAVGFGPRWVENRLYRQVEAIAGVEAPVRPGTLVDARKKIDPGRRSDEITAALGQPSLQSSSDGDLRREIWTYYYADGTMIVNLTGGIAERIAIRFGAPVIKKSVRPK
jgi:hypothetical protein